MKNRFIALFLLSVYSIFTQAIFAQDASIMLTNVWNHAYQENWNTDSVEAILDGARNAYVLLDAFDDPEARAAISAIKANGNTVGVYISVGTGEDWRDDFGELEGSLVEKFWGEWPGEFFIDRISESVRDVMKRRIFLASQWGADYIEFDNMDWAFDDVNRRKYGFAVTEEESLEYVNMLRDYAETLGLSCMAKNMTGGVESFAGVTYESWSDEQDWWNPADLKSFLAAGKLCVVFHYKERNPEDALEYYRSQYGNRLLVLIETRKSRGYNH